MILDQESWMNIRRFRALHDAGASYAEIATECGTLICPGRDADVGGQRHAAFQVALADHLEQRGVAILGQPSLR